ncbi:MAG TPA: NapC/NirT family cytochrome c [Usitatibacter sp.]|nr:NapC/NirT family cytochrome c [Usitatibacter sp.]
MAQDGSSPGFIRRTWRSLTSPSTRWSVLSLLLLGILIGFVAVVGTQVMVYVTGTDQFCGYACHSMQWVAKEHAQSVHAVNRTGVKAGCHDCHIPHNYPELLVYKAKAGIRDVIGEMRGVISTEEKFKKERLSMARNVWEEYRGNNSRACRTCHQFSKEMLAKQKEEVRPIHEAVIAGNGTCIDCHKGVAHKAPDE